MFPILLKIGPLTLRTYGFFVALGVIVGYGYLYKTASREKFSVEFISNLTFYCIIVGFLGSRIGYVIQNFEYYKENFLGVIKVWEGGMVFYPGLILGLLFGIFYTLFKKQNLLDVLDLYAPAIFLGQSIGRLGCFSAGCCYGKPTESFLGIVFTHPESLAPQGIKIFPTQLFESFYCIIIFLILHLLSTKGKFKSRRIFLGLILYSVFRFINEYFRNDDRGSPILGLSFSQFVSVVLLILNLIFIIYITFKLRHGKEGYYSSNYVSSDR